jgi:hypothetical protein
MVGSLELASGRRILTPTDIHSTLASPNPSFHPTLFEIHMFASLRCIRNRADFCPSRRGETWACFTWRS